MKLERENADKDELELLAMGSLHKAALEGDTENGSVMAGQIAGLVREISTVREVITSMFAEAKYAGREVYRLTGEVQQQTV
ncbi:hypothetical protein D3C80_1931990 [compost metagenome]